jgi:AcrR family transcriptional regulator
VRQLDGRLIVEMDTLTDALETKTVESGARPMRADAVKNRALILVAAEETFASEGLSVPIDEVAKRAGVGVGTLYRHFPTKEALFEAIVIARLERLVNDVRNYAASGDPAEALFNFIREFSVQACAKRDLMDALELAGFDFKSRCTLVIDEMLAAIDVLLQRAVKAGSVRADVSAQEIVNLVAGASHATAHGAPDSGGLSRMIGVVIDGLRTPSPVVGPTQ